MPLLLIIVGIILRSVVPELFYILGVAFLVFLIFSAYASIKAGEYGWKEGLATGIYAIIILWLMIL